MKLTMRRFQHDDDYWAIREFLREVFLFNNRREFSWQAYRFDYWRWHGILNMGDGTLETDVFIWETDDGQIGAVLNREAPGSAFLQIHPDRDTPELQEEMIAVAEQHLSVSAGDGQRKLGVWAGEWDPQRQDVLTRRGYVKSDKGDWQRYQPISEPIPDIPVTEGYTVRGLGDTDELPARSWVSWRAFHPNEPAEKYQGWEWYRNVQRAPLYRRDLDLVAVAPDGEFAAFGTIWFDDVTRTGAFEPMGTDPSHQRRGLASAVMYEGLRRLKSLGATLAFVGSWNEATHKLYGSCGFTEFDLQKQWVKEP